MTTLYHWTCDHGAKRINRTKVLRPSPQPFLGNAPLVWLTDLGPDALAAHPSRVEFARSLGLQSEAILACDRLAHCYRVLRPIEVEAWSEMVPRLVQHGFGDAVSALTLGRAQRHWWTSWAHQAVVPVWPLAPAGNAEP
jgi:hypothetical protein